MRRTAIALALFTFAIAAPVTSDTKLKAVGDNGTVVFLSNGETFEIRIENRPKVARWQKGETIRIYLATGDRAHPYRLVLRPERDDAEIVSAIQLQRESSNPPARSFSITR